MQFHMKKRKVSRHSFQDRVQDSYYESLRKHHPLALVPVADTLATQPDSRPGNFEES